MKSRYQQLFYLLPSTVILNCCNSAIAERAKDERPNIIVIYTDDVGYGDVSCYGATKVATPEIDKLAASGLMFTNAYATSATCTPSRYGLLTGEYPWRKRGTNIARGDATLIIDPSKPTVASVLKSAGYATAVIGKWHLGLGSEVDGGPDWNADLTPGPLDLGFEYAFLIPATGDRVPCVYVENRRVVGLNPDDPIRVSFDGPLGNEPTGKDNPELLIMHPSHGHDNTIVNGISRIGYMTGGHSARWRDEDMADMITGKALRYIELNKRKPFFLFFSTHDIHVPRVPHERFAGVNEMGPRGDVIVQMDWCVGEIMKKLKELKLLQNTLVLFTSDNGPVVDDGYHDEAVEKLGDHNPAGPLRGGKYSAFEGGTRIPFIISWPEKVDPGTSNALVSQVDIFSSFAALVGEKCPVNSSPDGHNEIETILGKNTKGREYAILQNIGGTLAIIKDNWKYIQPSSGQRVNRFVNIELGNDSIPQLYNISIDIGEQNNLQKVHPEKTAELSEMLDNVKARGGYMK
jgi:arylsulfatase A-like enzyme